MIKKTEQTLKERGIAEDSFFTIHHKDGTVLSEHLVNWSENGEVKVCEYFGMKKTVCVCTHPVKMIQIKHGDLHHTLEVPDGYEVYQSIRSETNFLQNGERTARTLGRVVGLVKDGEVVEEYFLNGIEGKVYGMKK